MDEQYIEILKKNIFKLESIDSDIIFFQAGVDSLKEDRYGKLNLSLDGLMLRNELIYEFAYKRKNPIIIFMGGGYSKPIYETVTAFKELFIFFSNYSF